MNSPSELVEPLSQLVARPLNWLWPGRLPTGKISIFDGDPGLGKSLVTLDLCARITTGRPFPDGSPAVPAANVIILSDEDSADDVIAPRLRVFGADLDRVFQFKKDFLEQHGPFRLPTHTEFLKDALEETRAVLVVIDPIMAFLDSSVLFVNDQSVRTALSPLADLAHQHGCHAIMVRHLNKSGHFHSLYRGGGSIAFVAASRSAFLFARNPEDPLGAVMAHFKNNYGPRQPSLAYRVQVNAEGPPNLDWLGESPLSADQLLAAAGIKPPLAGPAARARDFLTAFLEDGPRSTLDIWQAAAQQDFSQRTLYRLHEALQIRRKTVWVNNRSLTYWLLPNQKLPPEIDPKDPDIPSLEPWLAPLREQYPDDPLAGDL